MNVAHSIAEKVLDRANRRRDRPFCFQDVADLGNRAAVDQALSRLVRAGRLRRVSRGVYEVPRSSTFLKLPSRLPTDRVMQAWARRNGVRLIPSGSRAANLLRLSTQVPAKWEYYTNGPTRTVVIDGTPVRLKHRGPRVMNVKGQMSAAVIEALRYIGKDRAGDQEVRRLKSLLSDKDKAQLGRDLHFAPVWMRPLLAAVAGKEVYDG